MPSPTQPLAKIYTLKMVVNTIILWLKKENQQELDPEIVKGFVNLATLDVAEIISGAGSDDYGKTAIINDQASSVTTNIIQNANYTDAARNINKNNHGLTANDVGKRISVWMGTTIAAIGEIEEIIDNNNFKITKALGQDGIINYAVFSAHSTFTVDLSPYKIANITKITDSINKEVIKAGDREFDNLHRFDEKQNKVYWFKHGQYLYLYKGSNVQNIGTLTLWYTSYPQRVMNDDDYLDIRDNYIPLVVAKAKNYALEHLGMTAPESLTSLIDAKTREIRENILREKGLIEQKNRKGIES
ncbi:MAG: hypothetical protein QXD05_00210 [Candidatus Pacearchaeota archaeon]